MYAVATLSGRLDVEAKPHEGFTMSDPIVETWAIHNRINLYLLDAIADEALGSILNGKGRSVRDQFAHVHNVRLM